MTTKAKPVQIVAHDPSWPLLYEQEKQQLQQQLGDKLYCMEHIGSTAIEGVDARPEIDILVAVDSLAEIDSITRTLQKLSYSCTGKDEFETGWRFSSTQASLSYELYVFEQGDPEIERCRGFRDYLLQNPYMGQAYACIKRCLAAEFPYDTNHYVQGKDSFIRRVDYLAGVARHDQLQASDDVILQPYDPAWPKLAKAEINAIQQFTQLPFVTMQHLGSTSVEGLTAKPLIDIYIAVESIDDKREQWGPPLQALGYIDWPDNPDPTHLRFFKGMPPFGIRRTHHIHMMAMSERFENHILFRDALRNDESLCRQYAQLKQRLACQLSQDREYYTEQKGAFIQSVLAQQQ